MKKSLLFLALAAALPTFDASADALTKLWEYQTTDLNADWDGDKLDWSSADAIKDKPCTRFATAANGKFYTVNMQTMSIAEITADGWKDVYKLPKLETEGDYYGTAISIDEVGNFLIGHYFTKAPESSLVWSIYSPSTDKLTTFTLEDNDENGVKDLLGNWQIGRIDCVGRVLGDLTEEAQFFIAPQFDGSPHVFANIVRGVNIFVEDDNLTVTSNLYTGLYNATINKQAVQQGVAQPREHTLADFYDKHELEQAGFICYAKQNGSAPNVTGFNDLGAFDWTLYNAPFRQEVNGDCSGFDVFELDGDTYYAVSYSKDYEASNSRGMYVGIMDLEGNILGSWQSDDFKSNNGYSSIIAEPLEDGTANIYIYNSASADATNMRPARVGAAMLNFNPKNVAAEEELTYNPSWENVIEIGTAEELINLSKLLTAGENCVVLTADIDMAELRAIDKEGNEILDDNGETTQRVTSPLLADGNNFILHFDGRGHVIRNLLIDNGNASLFGYICGSVRNLGLENVNVSRAWYCVGGLAGTASKAIFDNCYVTGKAAGAAVGGLLGATKGEVVISNCYSRTDIVDDWAGNHAGGLVGRADNKLTIRNSFAARTINSKAPASGIVTIRDAKKVNLENVVVWQTEINGVEGKTDAIYVATAGTPTVNMTNVQIWDGVMVNGSKYSKGKSDEELLAMVHAWEAFHPTEEEEFAPVLNWQVDGVGGINDIVVDEENAPAVYYNLQGVQVANPDNGIYIVRRGNKVTKELVR